MRIGYARVSTPDQSLAIQLEALQQSGCPKIFQEVASGAQAERQALRAALDSMRPGDTLVVWRLDRLGRSLGQLIVLMNTLHQQQLGFQSVVEAVDTRRVKIFIHSSIKVSTGPAMHTSDLTPPVLLRARAQRSTARSAPDGPTLRRALSTCWTAIRCAILGT